MDGITWVQDQALTQDPTLKLITGTPGAWNSGTWGFQKAFYNPEATNIGSNPFDYTYTAYYDANTGTTYQTTGIAYSLDGKHWFNNQSSPVLNRTTGDANAWDFYTASFGSFLKDSSGVFHAWYSGGRTAGGYTDNFGIGYASSPDGLVWTKDSSNPIFTVLDGRTYRDERCYTPSVVDDGVGTLYMIYTAQGTAQTGRKKLGLATLKYNVKDEIELLRKRFQSGVETGIGTSQSIPHSLGVVPAITLASVYSSPSNYSISEGSHTSSDLIVTATSGIKFKIVAFA